MTIKACFCDNADLPIACAHDLAEPWNCVHASAGVLKEFCKEWDVQRAIELALDILGVKE